MSLSFKLLIKGDKNMPLKLALLCFIHNIKIDLQNFAVVLHFKGLLLICIHDKYVFSCLVKEKNKTAKVSLLKTSQIHFVK